MQSWTKVWYVRGMSVVRTLTPSMRKSFFARGDARAAATLGKSLVPFSFSRTG